MLRKTGERTATGHRQAHRYLQQKHKLLQLVRIWSRSENTL